MDTGAQIITCTLDPARAHALLTALGCDPQILVGDPLPPFFHHIYFWDAVAPDGLGQDGHPRVGGLIPDMGLPRRMWAGGRLQFHGPLRAGEVAEKHSVCESVTRKEGRTGPLAVVRLRHEIFQSGLKRITEWQNLIYRAAADLEVDVPATPPQAPEGTAQEEALRFDPTLLFRYSALTFNGHRIHYDQPYARDFEGYDGLVVHGPLLAQHLMLAAGDVTEFSYQATAPLMHHETATLCRRGDDLWVRGPEGRLCMKARIGSH